MSQPKGPTPRVSVRVQPTGIAHMDQLAAQNSTTRSEIVRRMLHYAVRHMPPTWTPPKK